MCGHTVNSKLQYIFPLLLITEHVPHFLNFHRTCQSINYLMSNQHKCTYTALCYLSAQLHTNTAIQEVYGQTIINYSTLIPYVNDAVIVLHCQNKYIPSAQRVERNNWHMIPKLITGITFFLDPRLFGLNREKINYQLPKKY